MKVTPVATPGDIQMTTTNNNNDARNRAIKMLETNSSSPQEAMQKLQHNSQQTPVQNANHVAPEEFSAVQASMRKPTASKVDTSILEAAVITEETRVPTAEVAKTDETATTKDPALTRQFAELARQERILRAKAQKQQQDLATQKQAIEAERAELADKAKQYESGWISKDRLKNDPLGVLAEAELSYDALTQQLLNQPARDPRIEAHIARLEAQNKALEAKLDAQANNQKQQQDENYKQAVKQITANTKRLIASEPETYEAIAKTGAVNDVVELIERTYKEEGYLMSEEDAAKEVESYLNDNLYETLNKIEKLKKRIEANKAAVVADKTASTEQQTQSVEKKEVAQQGAKTLTNSMSTAPKLSARDRAIAAMEGRLKRG